MIYKDIETPIYIQNKNKKTMKVTNRLVKEIKEVNAFKKEIDSAFNLFDRKIINKPKLLKLISDITINFEN